jgi:hypothetical protein
MDMSLTHIDSEGHARMVDVGHKPVTSRHAVAEGFITLAPATVRAIADGTVPKGEVLGTARIAGIMAAKRCPELIPLCHSLPLDSVEVQFDFPELEPPYSSHGKRVGQDRRGDGSTDCRRNFSADDLRHVQGDRQNDED